MLIVDFDAHHGNGTQDLFYARRTGALRVDARVAAVPRHWRPRRDRCGRRSGLDRELPVAGGRDRRRLSAPRSTRSSARSPRPGNRRGCCCRRASTRHRSDPLTGLGLSSGDFGDVTTRLTRLGLAGPSRRVPRRRLRPRGVGRLDRRLSRRAGRHRAIAAEASHRAVPAGGAGPPRRSGASARGLRTSDGRTGRCALRSAR